MEDQRLLVMIIDENPGVRELYSLELADRGYRVISIGDAAVIEEAAAGIQPDLILFDPWIGGKYRWDMVSGIKKRDTRVSVLLCLTFDCCAQDSLVAYADGFIIKSASINGLFQKIEQITKNKK